MARKRKSRNKKGDGSPWYDEKNKRYTWTLQHEGKRYRVAERDKAQADLQIAEINLYILPTLGEFQLCDIKRRHIVAWVNGMVNEPNEKGRYWSFNSIRQALSLLRAVPEPLEYNPAADVKVPAQRQGDEFNIDAGCCG